MITNQKNKLLANVGNQHNEATMREYQEEIPTTSGQPNIHQQKLVITIAAIGPRATKFAGHVIHLIFDVTSSFGATKLQQWERNSRVGTPT